MNANIWPQLYRVTILFYQSCFRLLAALHLGQCVVFFMQRVQVKQNKERKEERLPTPALLKAPLCMFRKSKNVISFQNKYRKCAVYCISHWISNVLSCVFPRRLLPVLQPLNANQQWREGSRLQSRRAPNTLSAATVCFFSARSVYAVWLNQADAHMFNIVAFVLRFLL